MKKVIRIILMVICIILSLAGCGACEHEWREPTCDEPMTCVKCGVTEGESLGHEWEDATYTSPKTCSRCGLTEGEPEESPYKNCKTWEDVFRLSFSDDFSIKSDGNAYLLTFSSVNSIQDFMVDAFLSTSLIGKPEIAGVPFDNSEIDGALFRLDGVGTVVAAKFENAFLGVVTELVTADENEKTKEMQKIYDDGFGPVYDVTPKK